MQPQISKSASSELFDDDDFFLSDVNATATADQRDLDWWLGNALQTARALELGCYFSVNSHMLQRQDLLEQLLLDRVLTETDHPFGDRANGRAHRPGRVDDVERRLATMHGVKQVDIRGRVWTNLADIVSETKCGPLLLAWSAGGCPRRSTTRSYLNRGVRRASWRTSATVARALGSRDCPGRGP